jgi:hypothetical protein
LRKDFLAYQYRLAQIFCGKIILPINIVWPKYFAGRLSCLSISFGPNILREDFLAYQYPLAQTFCGQIFFEKIL